jgi:hypothetical protein
MPPRIPPCRPDAPMSPRRPPMPPRRRRGLYSAARGAACAGTCNSSPHVAPTPPCHPPYFMPPQIPLCRPDEGGASTARREALPARAPANPPRPPNPPPCRPDAPMPPRIPPSRPDAPMPPQHPSMPPRRRRGLYSAAKGAACAGARKSSAPSQPPHVAPTPPCRPKFLYVAPTKEGPLQRGEWRCLRGHPQFLPPCLPEFLHASPTPPCRPDALYVAPTQEGPLQRGERRCLRGRPQFLPPCLPEFLHASPTPPCRPDALYVAPTQEGPLQRGERRCLRGRPQFLPPCRPDTENKSNPGVYLSESPRAHSSIP